MTNENTMWLVVRMNSDSYTATLYDVDPLRSRDIRMHSEALSDLHDVFESEGRSRIGQEVGGDRQHGVFSDGTPSGVIEVWM